MALLQFFWINEVCDIIIEGLGIGGLPYGSGKTKSPGLVLNDMLFFPDSRRTYYTFSQETFRKKYFP